VLGVDNVIFMGQIWTSLPFDFALGLVLPLVSIATPEM
jgi:hypothetical protein